MAGLEPATSKVFRTPASTIPPHELAAGQGFEPQSLGPEPSVMPLYYPAKNCLLGDGVSGTTVDALTELVSDVNHEMV